MNATFQAAQERAVFFATSPFGVARRLFVHIIILIYIRLSSGQMRPRNVLNHNVGIVKVEI